MLTERNLPWIAYGEFSGFRLVPDYRGPRPTDDAFVPYDGAFDKLEVPQDRKLVHAFRRAMLLEGVDLVGLAGMTTAAHTEADVERTAAAVASALEAIQSEK